MLCIENGLSKRKLNKYKKCKKSQDSNLQPRSLMNLLKKLNQKIKLKEMKSSHITTMDRKITKGNKTTIRMDTTITREIIYSMINRIIIMKTIKIWHMTVSKLASNLEMNLQRLKRTTNMMINSITIINSNHTIMDKRIKAIDQNYSISIQM